MRGLVVGAFFVAAVAGCTVGSVSSPILEGAKSQVAQALKDPDSAQFRNLYDFAFLGGRMVCGEVNARNSLGGHAGFSNFSVAVGGGGDWAAPSLGSTVMESEMTRMSCGYWQQYVQDNDLADRMPSAAERAKVVRDYEVWARKAADVIYKKFGNQ